MEQFTAVLLENPLYLAVAVIVSIAVLLLFLRKILRVAVVLAAVVVLYVAYLHWSGEDIPDVLQRMEETAGEYLQKGAEFLREFGGGDDSDETRAI